MSIQSAIRRVWDLCTVRMSPSETLTAAFGEYELYDVDLHSAHTGAQTAAPHIARAAQVAVLRETADEINEMVSAAASPQAEAVYRLAASLLHHKADRIERGEGEPDVR